MAKKARTTGRETSRGIVGARRRAPPGAAPGTLIADPAAHPPAIDFIGYGPDAFEERTIADAAEVGALRGKWPVLWVNVSGLADIGTIQALGDLFGLHRLALEDVVNVHQRSKSEAYDDHVFIVTRIVAPAAAVATEQISLFLGEGFVLTFQERPGDCFEPVRDRLRGKRGRIREFGADYLAYALLDAAIDGYFPVLEAYGERLEALEDSVMANPEPGQGALIHEMKRDLLTLRRAIWPLREMANGLGREVSPLIGEQTRLHLRDCYDHTIQLLDVVETYREIASGLVDVYLSSTSARLNEIMKVLTIIATIFIPLGFIAGLYGMNFDPKVSPWNMPELSWYLGYPFALGLMALIAGGLLYYFRRKGWLGGAGKRD